MNSFIFDIWLHVGREGRCFSYQDGNNLDIDLGDVVTVRLKGQHMQGPVSYTHLTLPTIYSV